MAHTIKNGAAHGGKIRPSRVFGHFEWRRLIVCLVMIVVEIKLRIPTGVISLGWLGSMLVVPEFGQDSLQCGIWCQIILEAVRYIGSEVLEVFDVCHK
jgi:hypothetical protein